MNNITDFDFLHGYYEPTLLILYEPVKTFAGRIAVRKDTCAMVSSLSPDVVVVVVSDISFTRSLPAGGHLAQHTTARAPGHLVIGLAAVRLSEGHSRVAAHRRRVDHGRQFAHLPQPERTSVRRRAQLHRQDADQLSAGTTGRRQPGAGPRHLHVHIQRQAGHVAVQRRSLRHHAVRRQHARGEELSFREMRLQRPDHVHHRVFGLVFVPRL